MTEPLRRRASVMRLWADERSRVHGIHGHSAVLSGTMAQSLVTEPHQRYRLTYSVHGIPSSDSGRGGIGDLLIDAMVVQTFVAPSGTDAVAHEAYFTAQSPETLLSFAVVGQIPFALRDVSATKVAVPPVSEYDMLGAVLCA